MTSDAMIESVAVWWRMAKTGMSPDGAFALAGCRGQARECDFVFLAVGGDFSKEWAQKIAEGVRNSLLVRGTELGLAQRRRFRGLPDGDRSMGSRRLKAPRSGIG